MYTFDLSNFPEREDEINFDDIYEKHENPIETDFDATVVVVDGAPIVTKEKEEKLLAVLTKLFTKNAGKIKQDGICMPMNPNEEGVLTSSGFLFIEFEAPESAEAAIKNLNGHKLSKTVTLSVNKFSDVEKYSALTEEYVEPEIKPFTPIEHLKSYLMDPQARDQFVMYRGDNVSVYWNKKTEPPEHIYSRNNWTEIYIQWSPKGTYLCTIHAQGVALWGGPSWNKIIRFVHPGVKLIDFSPNERYLVTWSDKPLNLLKDDHFFTDYDKGNHFVIWDVRTGAVLRSFPAFGEQQKKIRWPMFKWSISEKYFARVVPGEQLSIYEAPSMGLLDKKSIKIPGIVDFEWAPHTDKMLAYWTPEINDKPARVAVMEVTSKTAIVTKNLFNVSECKLYWQSQGQYLAVNVNRHKKTKKSLCSNLEIFHLNQKDIPVETIDLKDLAIAFAWEPSGQRFACITTPSDPVTASTPHKNKVDFYSFDTKTSEFKLLKRHENKSANSLSWSPHGNDIVLASLRSSVAYDLEFYRVDMKKVVSKHEQFGLSDIEWDPTGRYVITSSSMWHRSKGGDHGFCIWDFKGDLLFKQSIDKFKQLLWRPRPPSLLSAAQKKTIKKNLRQYSKEFDQEDFAQRDAATAKRRIERKKAFENWYTWRKTVEQDLQKERRSLGNPDQTIADQAETELVEEWIEQVYEETEEIIDQNI